jgi:hypothetical protein
MQRLEKPYVPYVSHLEALTASVRTVRTRLAFNYLAPSALTSIGNMAAKLDEIWKKVGTQGGRLDSYKGKITMSADHQVKLGQEDFYRHLEDCKASCFHPSITGSWEPKL